MRPGARIAATIELATRLEGSDRPAEREVAGYLRARRYIGAKDRRALTDRIFGFLRARARIAWHLDRAGQGEAGSPRLPVLAYLVLAEGERVEALTGLCDGTGYGPSPLTPREREALAALEGLALDHPDQPVAVRGEVPEWLLPELQRTLGDGLEAELAALEGEAPLDLRVNSLKGGRADAVDALAQDAIAAQPTPFSPLGLRVGGRRAITGSAAFRSGLVEIQDEGSQVVALLVDARPGMAVADFCAGAGGKTLALAAAMENRGRLLALDRDAKRLARATPRLERAGASLVEPRCLEAGDPPGELHGAFERVLADVSCSGIGTWRRQPDARWRLTPEMLSAYQAGQAETLAQAARLVCPGGRLIYATCSLLHGENEAQIDAFLAGNDEFKVQPLGEVWERVFARPLPEGLQSATPYLRLTPASAGTDGFFVALLERLDSAGHDS